METLVKKQMQTKWAEEWTMMTALEVLLKTELQTEQIEEWMMIMAVLEEEKNENADAN